MDHALMKEQIFGSENETLNRSTKIGKQDTLLIFSHITIRNITETDSKRPTLVPERSCILDCV